MMRLVEIWKALKQLDIPKGYIVLLVLGYILMPTDIITDIIPFLGQGDDAFVLIMGVALLFQRNHTGSKEE